MQFSIEVISRGEPTQAKNNRGGDYKKVEVVYKKDGKVEAKAFADFANKEIFPKLLALNAGDVRVVTSEKVNGFWNWVAIGDAGETGSERATTQSTASEPAIATLARKAGYAGTPTGRDYETGVERTARQKYIIAQSSIGAAVATLQTGKAAVDQDAVLKAADTYYQWVMKKGVDFSDMKDDTV